MPTTPDDGSWADTDRTGDTAMLIMRLLHRLRSGEVDIATCEADIAAIEASMAAHNSRLVVIETRLGLVNALLHLW